MHIKIYWRAWNNLSYSLKGSSRGGGVGSSNSSGGNGVKEGDTTASTTTTAAAAPPVIDYEFLHAVALALGRMAMGAANVDCLEFEIGRGLKWLRSD